MHSVAIHQPNLFARLKVLQKLTRARNWVVYDTVQFCQREWQNRSKIRQHRKPEFESWATIPVHLMNGRSTLISEVEAIDLNKSFERIVRSVENNYSPSPYVDFIFDYLLELNNHTEENFTEFVVQTTTILFEKLGIEVRAEFASSLLCERTNGKEKNQRLIDICHEIGATKYLCGSGGRTYLNAKQFKASDIAILLQDWVEPPYSPVPVRNYSSIDFIARFGPDALRCHLLTSGS